MASPLQGSIAKAITAAFRSVLYKLTYHKFIESIFIPDPGEFINIYATSVCTGFVDTYNVQEIDVLGVLSTDKKVLILARTLAVTPTTSDQIVLSDGTYNVNSVESDPAGATWTLGARPAS